ncbi:MAG: tRNA (5-methylaminomethyl-2-thiouridine)(34)-methyltransferase MnmD [Opitutaceae bacterium]|nr:tRNA (5-methylaminomethyl-2-thiouridine)(34)-methyltransferase MnmD [Cytophagales bacterium]
MTHQIILTDDNSFTIFIPEMDETYHSRKGAIAESLHVYIKYGLELVASTKDRIKIFEFGFGTGLNALLSWQFAETYNKTIFFDTVEKYPLGKEVYSILNYDEQLQTGKKLLDLHGANWNEPVILSENFILQKFDSDINLVAFPKDYYDLVFYDAFAPSKQAEVWEISILKKIYDSMITGGILSTYCSQGEFNRNLKSVGFKVEKIAGPLGKREMIRAMK